ncbi:MAG TPA: phosphatase PAP2 family protein [Micromonospora sp.]
MNRAAGEREPEHGEREPKHGEREPGHGEREPEPGPRVNRAPRAGRPSPAPAGAAQVLVSVAVFGSGGLAVALLAPGGLAGPRSELLRDGRSAELYRSAVDSVRDTPGWLPAIGEHAAVGGLLLLAALLAWTGWTGWRHRTSQVAGCLLVGVGAVAAYLGSEGLKVVVDEERPCRVFDTLPTLLPCPEPGDWSFPSNHSTVAGALATGLVLLVPRLLPLAVPAAVLVAGTRGVTGVHYPHDVLAGLLLGGAVTVPLLVLLTPLVDRLVGTARTALRV